MIAGLKQIGSRFFYFAKALIFFPFYLWLDLCDFFYTVFKFYPINRFWRADLSILFRYFWLNPYTICKRYLEAYPDELVQKVYGETFFTTLEKVRDRVGLTADDVVYELGSGRGRSCFWFGCVVGCKTVGIELNPQFVYHAQQVAKKLSLSHIEFQMINMMEVDYSEATCIYLYGSCLGEAAMRNLIQALQTCRKGTWLVTVTNPLDDYQEDHGFEYIGSSPARYLWGYTGLYFHRKL